MLQALLSIIVAMQLRVDSDIAQYELELRLALLAEHLHHQLVELLGVHGLEDLIFHMPCRFPKTRWNIHLTETVPVNAHSFHIQILAEMVRSVLSHLRQVDLPCLHVS